jgi:hypothetical protein
MAKVESAPIVSVSQYLIELLLDSGNSMLVHVLVVGFGI